MQTSQIPVGEEGGPGSLPNLMKQGEEEEDREEKKKEGGEEGEEEE